MRSRKFSAIVLSGLLVIANASAQAPERRLSVLKSGFEFQSDSIRKLQGDDFANPGSLWTSRGEQLWTTVAGTAQKSCASCHGAAAMSMKGVAARYPAFDKSLGRVLDLEARINSCRVNHQVAQPYESLTNLIGCTETMSI